ncbi:MAG: outer membrane lipoprotein carrier protein LolA [Acidobacteriota bacterium]|nr:outer membrane lipoprotein carrier protein LolA [Acidobacteriota bacterium]
MREQRRRGPAVLLTCPIIAALASLLLHAAAPGARDLFDEIYARGRGIESSLKTVTARFTETTTSSLLSRPLVARGTLAVERPSKIVLRYSDPEPRTVLIDQNRLTLVWPSHAVHQETDIASAQRRIEKYFIDKSPDELRRNFTITATEADDRAGTWRVTMVPTRKQIQQGLTRLDLWIDRTTMLLAKMQMTFPNEDTKLMVFENVVVNGPVDQKMFFVGDAR